MQTIYPKTALNQVLAKENAASLNFHFENKTAATVHISLFQMWTKRENSGIIDHTGAPTYLSTLSEVRWDGYDTMTLGGVGDTLDITLENSSQGIAYSLDYRYFEVDPTAGNVDWEGTPSSVRVYNVTRKYVTGLSATCFRADGVDPSGLPGEVGTTYLAATEDVNEVVAISDPTKGLHYRIASGSTYAAGGVTEEDDLAQVEVTES